MKSRKFECKEIPELGVKLVSIDDEWICSCCGKISFMHGLVETRHGEVTVCPDEYVVSTGDDVLVVTENTYKKFFLYWEAPCEQESKQ